MPDAGSTLSRSQRIGVVGGGAMGVGIVYVFAAAQFPVWLIEPDDARAGVAAQTLRDAAQAGVKRGKLNETDAQRALANVRRRSSSLDLPEQLDLVIETVPERFELKQKVLAEISSRRPALIATNTSALSIDALASCVADASSFLGMHFFNPVWSLPMVEIIRGAATSEAALAHAQTFAEAIGKTTITVSDTPGFATSRLDLITSMEAIRMLQDGVASAEDIDKAMGCRLSAPDGTAAAQ